MINRRYLRTKVMQAIFAFEINKKKDYPQAEKNLNNSIQDFYKLFIYLFSLFPEMKHYREVKLESLKEKFNPTEADLNPNTKFVDNAVITQIENCAILKQLFSEHKNNWGDNLDVVHSIYNEIAQSEYFDVYMNNTSKSYEEDKKFVLKIVEKTFANSELLHWFLEEQNVHWFDDYNDALLMLYKNIDTFKESHGNKIKITPLWKDEMEDKDFYKNLFKKTILNDTEYQSIIEKNLQNWEADRLIGLDIIILKMAMCEILEFPDIPIKVTINEYIELAKNYSSNKSGIFVNGMLDKIISEFKAEDRIKKVGRGLIQ